MPRSYDGDNVNAAAGTWALLSAEASLENGAGSNPTCLTPGIALCSMHNGDPLLCWLQGWCTMWECGHPKSDFLYLRPACVVGG